MRHYVGLMLAENLQGAHQALGAARPTGRGRRPREGVEFVVAGPPPYGKDAWSEDHENEWAQASYEWLCSVLGPQSVVVTAALHRDETAPHIHVLGVPIDAEGRLGWCRVRDEAVGRIGPTQAGKGRRKYRTLQDDYHAQVGQRYGLARGEIGSRATHQAIDRARAAEARAQAAE